MGRRRTRGAFKSFGPTILAAACLTLAACGGRSNGGNAGDGGGNVGQAAEHEPSSTLKTYGDYWTVPNWTEKAEPIDGPSKLLVYSKDSDDFRSKLIMSCESGRIWVLVGQVGGSENALDVPVDVSLRVDEQAPEKMTFASPAGQTGLSPGDGGAAAASAFLHKVAGSKKVAIRLDDSIGMHLTDPAMVFDTTGSEALEHNVLLACGGAKAAASTAPVREQVAVVPSSAAPDRVSDAPYIPTVVKTDPVYMQDFKAGQTVDLAHSYYVCRLDDPGDALDRLVDQQNDARRRGLADSLNCPFDGDADRPARYKVLRLVRSVCKDESTSPGGTTCGREGHQLLIQREYGTKQVVLWLSQDQDVG